MSEGKAKTERVEIVPLDPWDAMEMINMRDGGLKIKPTEKVMRVNNEEGEAIVAVYCRVKI